MSSLSSFSFPSVSSLRLGVQGQADVVLKLKLGRRVVGARNKVDLEVLLDGEHGVVLEVLGRGVEDLCRDCLVASGLNLGVLVVHLTKMNKRAEGGRTIK